MKRYLCLYYVLTVMLFSCNEDVSNINYPLSTTDAKVIIEEWIYKNFNTQMNPGIEYSLQEYTTKEIYEKLNGQVFYIESEVPCLGAVFIKDKRVYNLYEDCQYRVGDELNFVVTDLNQDSKYELIYQTEFGSGIRYSQLNCFYFLNDSTSETLVYPLTVCSGEYNFNFNMKTNGFQKLILKYIDKTYSIKIGEVRLEEIDNVRKFLVKFDGEIPAEIAWKLFCD